MRTRILLPALLVAISVLALASPAGATVAGPINSEEPFASVTVTGAPSNTSAAETTTIALGASRTIINMSGFQLSPEDTLNFDFGSRSDIVLLRVAGGAATVGGILRATVGAARGGNVWIQAPNGVVFGPNAQVEAGGVLAGASDVGSTDFLDGDSDFTFLGAPAPGAGILLQAGASLRAYGGLLGFVAPSVVHVNGASATSPGAGSPAEVLYGSAATYELGLASNSSNGYDLRRFDPQTGGAGSIALGGAITGDDVFVSSLAAGPGAPALLADNVTANGAAASGDGNVVLSAGGGVERAGGVGPMLPTQRFAAPAQEIQIGNANGASVRAAASGDLRLVSTPGGRIDASHAGVSTGAIFRNDVGAGVMAGVGQWVVRAPSPGGHTYNGLNSGATARWGAGLGALAPNAFSTNRYAFAQSPTLTFTADDVTKSYGTDLTGLLTDFSVAGLHPGVAGVFAPDTEASSFSGSPALSSDGTAIKAMVGRSPYAIGVAQGTLTALAGHTLAYSDAGDLTVVPCKGEAGCPDEADPTLAFTQPGANAAGWHNGTGTSHVVADGGFSGIYSLGCTLNEGTATLASLTSADFDPWSGDVSETAEGVHEIVCHAEDGAENTATGTDELRVDKTAPVPSLSADRDPDYESGGTPWYRDSVTFSFGGTDPDLGDGSPGSGVAPGPAAVTRNTTGPHTVSGSVSDIAGNSAPVSRSFEVDATDPTLTIDCPETVFVNGTADVTIDASDGESGLRNDPSEAIAVDTSEVGPQTVTVTATDNVGNETQRTCTTNVVYRFGGFHQPINPDGSSVFKLGSTVPVKIALTDANGLPVTTADATLQLAKLTSNVEGTTVEATSTAAATTGNHFRSDSLAGQYIFNLGTKPLSTGTWRLKVLPGDGTTHTIQIALR